MKIIVALTGASGIAYGLRLAETFKEEELSIAVSENAKKVMKYEIGDVGKTLKELGRYGKLYNEDEIEAPPASGSSSFDAMVICPCSMKTLSAIANGYSYNLITRSADVMLKGKEGARACPQGDPCQRDTPRKHAQALKAGRRRASRHLPVCTTSQRISMTSSIS